MSINVSMHAMIICLDQATQAAMQTLTPASILPITTPNTSPKPIPITPDMTVLMPQLFIISSWTICSGVGICICLYSFLGLPLFVGCVAGGSCAEGSADGTGLDELGAAPSFGCDMMLINNVV